MLMNQASGKIMHRKLIRKILVLLLVFVFCINTAQEAPLLKPWVKQASTIYVRILGTYWQVPIQDKTTIDELKQSIKRSDGIRAEYQIINPFWKKWWTLWYFEGHGPTLDNNQNIKRIMNEYNTNLFELRNAKEQQTQKE